MSAPQWTFALVTLLLAGSGTFLTYPGIRAHARSRSHSMLAALMASTLFALPIAMLIAGIVNTFVRGAS